MIKRAFGKKKYHKLGSLILCDAEGSPTQPNRAVKAKDLVDGAPGTVLEGATKEDAEKAKEALEAAGASIELK